MTSVWPLRPIALRSRNARTKLSPRCSIRSVSAPGAPEGFRAQQVQELRVGGLRDSISVQGADDPCMRLSSSDHVRSPQARRHAMIVTVYCPQTQLPNVPLRPRCSGKGGGTFLLLSPLVFARGQCTQPAGVFRGASAVSATRYRQAPIWAPSATLEFLSLGWKAE